jgi:hypothetical protein
MALPGSGVNDRGGCRRGSRCAHSARPRRPRMARRRRTTALPRGSRRTARPGCRPARGSAGSARMGAIAPSARSPAHSAGSLDTSGPFCAKAWAWIPAVPDSESNSFRCSQPLYAKYESRSAIPEWMSSEGAPTWLFLTNHARVLVCIAETGDARSTRCSELRGRPFALAELECAGTVGRVDRAPLPARRRAFVRSLLTSLLCDRHP